MIMIGTRWLHMGVAVVDAEIHPAHAFVIPNMLAVDARPHACAWSGTAHDFVAGLPDLSGARIEHDSVERDAKQIAANRPRLLESSRLQRHFKVVTLLFNRVRI